MNKQTIPFLLLVALILGSFTATFAQRANPMFSAPANELVAGEAVRVFDLRSKDPLNTTYWLDDWYPGEVITKGGGKLTGYKFKYDVVNHNIDLQYGDSVKVLPGNLIKEFTLYHTAGNRRFVDLNSELKVNTYQLGFFEIIAVGDLILLGKMETELLRSNYVATHDAGSSRDKFVKKHSYFMLKNGELIRIPKKKSEAITFFEKEKKGTTAFMKENKIKCKKRSDLLKIFNYLNSKNS
ncbi:MAG: hypothetical protein MRZ79_09425 [Bacteroidia bacterium]|nr:hypothetical protein [Bacteroidia bacterium]